MTLEATANRPFPARRPLPTQGESPSGLPNGASARRPVGEGGSTAQFAGLLLPLLATVGVSVILTGALLHFRESLEQLGHWGYVGVFAAEFGNSAAIIVPTPGPAYTLAMSVVLHPLLLGLLGGVAAALGELVGYAVGARGSEIVPGGRLYARLQTMTARWGGGVLFAFAVLPLPFDVAGVWAGAVRYPLWRFAVYVTLGKVIKVTTIALAGYYGINRILEIVG